MQVSLRQKHIRLLEVLQSTMQSYAILQKELQDTNTNRGSYIDGNEKERIIQQATTRMNSDIHKLQTLLEERTSALESAMAEISITKDENHELKSKLKQAIEKAKLGDVLQLEVDATRKKLKEVETNFSGMNKKHNKFIEKIAKLYSHIEDLQQDKTESEREFNEFKLEIAKLEQDNRLLSGESKELNKLQDDMKSLRSNLDISREESHVYREQYDKSADEAAALRRTLLELENLLNSSTHQISGMAAKIQLLTEENNNLRIQNNQLEGLVRQTSSGKFRRFVDLKEEKAELEKEMNSVKKNNLRLLKAVRKKASGGPKRLITNSSSGHNMNNYYPTATNSTNSLQSDSQSSRRIRGPAVEESSSGFTDVPQIPTKPRKRMY